MKKLMLVLFLICSAFSLSNIEKSLTKETTEEKIDMILSELSTKTSDKGKIKGPITNKADSKEKEQDEFRAVWVASVGNIDWPSKKNLSVDDQKREFINILENVKKWNMNAVVVQIKPVGDSFYPSESSPWSSYLTGVQGKNPGYDPLSFMVDESHKRGIEFHAWFNPYRLSVDSNTSKLSSDNILFQKPEWTVKYAGKYYLNPGVPGVDKYVIDGVMEVVKKYDIDGVHFDDYFYPYKVGKEEYNDYNAYNRYGKGFNNIADWRRNNVNKLVEGLNTSIKKEKPDMRFGISPFGVWRNSSTDPARGSDTKAGVQNYDDLYADILLWMEEGWIDYVAPQIYWNQGFKVADYNTLVEWWSDASKKTKTDLYIGHAAYKIREWKDDSEISKQVTFNRIFPEVKGSIFFSYKSLIENPRATSLLINGPYDVKYKIK